MTNYQKWVKRLRSGELGEDEARPSTWVLDDLWRKAGHELTNAEYRYVIGGKGTTPPDDLEKLLKANRELLNKHRTPERLK